ncbi:purine-nucleoside phosphorylase [Silvibacterium acidisoli]|uniref:purine-nucleoside phosphorylase n=1 Tax=Acidobacteriaceae bacterium ZG23-2 TaxID=2883246 RepID=UPI00406C47F5
MSSHNSFDQAAEAAAYLSARLTIRPAIAVVLGSGLGGFAAELGQPVTIPYSEIPHFPQSTVPGHHGQLVAGTLKGVPLIVMQGRVHGYEGYSPEQVVFPVRVLRCLGIRSLVLTNAAGGIRESLKQGQLVLLSDHINFTGKNPVAGANDERFGPRFFDMSEAYSKTLREIAQRAAQSEGYVLEEGVYLGLLGPSFETPAEIRAFRTMGADLVGMSTVMETIAARHMGIEVLGISCVTNMAAGIQAEPLSHEEVMETGRRVESTIARLLKRVIPAMAARLDEPAK